MTQVFKQNLPEDIIARYDLDEERLANDLARCFKKASVEYITSLKGRPDNGLIRRMQKRLAKRSLVKQERKDKRVVKRDSREVSIPPHLMSGSAAVSEPARSFCTRITLFSSSLHQFASDPMISSTML
jgi:hypothetical protein